MIFALQLLSLQLDPQTGSPNGISFQIDVENLISLNQLGNNATCKNYSNRLRYVKLKLFSNKSFALFSFVSVSLNIIFKK